MDMEHEIPKNLGSLATHGDGEPPKTLDARYVQNINGNCFWLLGAYAPIEIHISRS